MIIKNREAITTLEMKRVRKGQITRKIFKQLNVRFLLYQIGFV